MFILLLFLLHYLFDPQIDQNDNANLKLETFDSEELDRSQKVDVPELKPEEPHEEVSGE